MKTKNKILHVRVTEEEFEAFSAYAKNQDESKSEVLRRLIERTIQALTTLQTR